MTGPLTEYGADIVEGLSTLWALQSVGVVLAILVGARIPNTVVQVTSRGSRKSRGRAAMLGGEGNHGHVIKLVKPLVSFLSRSYNMHIYF